MIEELDGLPEGTVGCKASGHVSGDKAWQKMAERVMAQFVNAKAKFFDRDDYKGAVAWASS